MLDATVYDTPKEILSTVSEVAGMGIPFASITPEQYKWFLSEAMAEEMLESHPFVEKSSHYIAKLNESPNTIQDNPTA